jgi:hypothetical protein
VIPILRALPILVTDYGKVATGIEQRYRKVRDEGIDVPRQPWAGGQRLCVCLFFGATYLRMSIILPVLKSSQEKTMSEPINRSINSQFQRAFLAVNDGFTRLFFQCQEIADNFPIIRQKM